MRRRRKIPKCHRNVATAAFGTVKPTMGKMAVSNCNSAAPLCGGSLSVKGRRSTSGRSMSVRHFRTPSAPAPSRSLVAPPLCAHSTRTAAADVVEPPNFGLAGEFVNALFGFPPLFEMAAAQARKTIKTRAETIGIDWDGELQKYQGHDWEQERKSLMQVDRHPEYYCKPFHAYPEGNLGWKPAHEAEVAAMSVHATVFAPNPDLDDDGDGRLRRSGSEAMKVLMEKLGARAVEDIVDIGCATGLSSLELAAAFPQANVQGVDLSEYFLSVAEWNKDKALSSGAENDEESQRHARIMYHHAPGERTGLPDSSADLVSACLVFHELPSDAAVGVLKEAHRLLRPGGVLAIHEMDPNSPAFQRIANNIFAFTAFKSTEPYLDQYMALDLHGEIAAQGFSLSEEAGCSPRHRTVVAIKK